MAPWADVLYACDAKWWEKYPDALTFQGAKITQDHRVKNAEVIKIVGDEAVGLSKDPRIVNIGGNGGYQAVNLAFHLGASRIVLLGYDMQDDQGKKHWHGNHEGINNPDHFCFAAWLENFDQLAVDLEKEGVEVINCTRNTALTCFKRDVIENVI